MCYAYFSLHVSTVYEINVFCGFMHKYIVYIVYVLYVYVGYVYAYAGMWHVYTYVIHTLISLHTSHNYV